MRKTKADTPKAQAPTAHVYIDEETLGALLLAQARRQASWIPSEYDKDRFDVSVLTDELGFGTEGGLHVIVLIDPTEDSE